MKQSFKLKRRASLDGLIVRPSWASTPYHVSGELIESKAFTAVRAARVPLSCQTNLLEFPNPCQAAVAKPLVNTPPQQMFLQLNNTDVVQAPTPFPSPTNPDVHRMVDALEISSVVSSHIRHQAIQHTRGAINVGIHNTRKAASFIDITNLMKPRREADDIPLIKLAQEDHTVNTALAKAQTHRPRTRDHSFSLLDANQRNQATGARAENRPAITKTSSLGSSTQCWLQHTIDGPVGPVSRTKSASARNLEAGRISCNLRRPLSLRVRDITPAQCCQYSAGVLEVRNSLTSLFIWPIKEVNARKRSNSMPPQRAPVVHQGLAPMPKVPNVKYTASIDDRVQALCHIRPSIDVLAEPSTVRKGREPRASGLNLITGHRRAVSATRFNRSTRTGDVPRFTVAAQSLSAVSKRTRSCNNGRANEFLGPNLGFTRDGAVELSPATKKTLISNLRVGGAANPGPLKRCRVMSDPPCPLATEKTTSRSLFSPRGRAVSLSGVNIKGRGDKLLDRLGSQKLHAYVPQKKPRGSSQNTSSRVNKAWHSSNFRSSGHTIASPAIPVQLRRARSLSSNGCGEVVDLTMSRFRRGPL